MTVSNHFSAGLISLGQSPALKEDEELGPKTATRLKDYLIKKGAAFTQTATNLGAFETMLEKNRRRPLDTSSIKTTIPSLFGSQNAVKKFQTGLSMTA